MILIISGGGLRGFYAIGCLSALEELGIKKKVKAVYGVSAGAIIGTFWLNNFSGKDIYNIFEKIDIIETFKINIFSGKSIFHTKQIEKIFVNNLPNSFSQLTKKMYIGAVDLVSGKFKIYSEGELIKPLLGSMAIPGLFEPISINNELLVDGGVVNNFPATIAKKKYPKEKMLGIVLNKIAKKEKINNIIESLSRSIELIIESSSIYQLNDVDYLLHPKLEINILDIRKELYIKTYNQGYNETIKLFYKKKY